jgi:hypothetical protein
MADYNKINILWTNDNVMTSDKMVFMYAVNSLINDWWKEVTVIIWGATAKLVAENEYFQEKIKMAIHTGVKFMACKACADQVGASDVLTSLGIEVVYIGEHFTELLKADEKLITI